MLHQTITNKYYETKFKRFRSSITIRIYVWNDLFNFNIFIIMKDLLDYNRFRIEVMQNKICELQGKLTKLQSFCFEVLDEECPKEYKTLVKKEIYNLTEN